MILLILLGGEVFDCGVVVVVIYEIFGVVVLCIVVVYLCI